MTGGNDATTPELGDFGVVATYGSWLDRLIGRLIRWDTESPVNHAFVYIGAGRIVEAQPGGAAIGLATEYDGIVWSTDTFLPILSTAQRQRIVAAALKDVGVGYSWLDIVAIAFAQRRWGHLVTGREWWAKRISNMHRLICSQLVDECYLMAGVHLFTDGRYPGQVSPGDLDRLIHGRPRP